METTTTIIEKARLSHKSLNQCAAGDSLDAAPLGWRKTVRDGAKSLIDITNRLEVLERENRNLLMETHSYRCVFEGNGILVRGIDGSRPNMDVIMKHQLKVLAVLCCREFGIDDLSLKTRRGKYPTARGCYAYFARRFFGKKVSLTAIGKQFDGLDHSTILNSIARCEEKYDIDAVFRVQMDSIRNQWLAGMQKPDTEARLLH